MEFIIGIIVRIIKLVSNNAIKNKINNLVGNKVN